MKKALIYLSPIDREYLKEYGKLPDYDYTDLYKQYGSQKANEIVQKRANAVWKKMQENHKKENDKLLSECPFAT